MAVQKKGITLATGQKKGKRESLVEGINETYGSFIVEPGPSHFTARGGVATGSEYP